MGLCISEGGREWMDVDCWWKRCKDRTSLPFLFMFILSRAQEIHEFIYVEFSLHLWRLLFGPSSWCGQANESIEVKTGEEGKFRFSLNS